MPSKIMISSPFTIDHLLSLQRVAYDVPLHLSPNGRWLAISVQTSDRNTPRKVFHFGEDGVPTTMQRTRVLIVDTTTGETQTPFSQSTSWGGQWSPDGRLLAAYVKDEGMVCLGLWDSITHDLQLWQHVQGRSFGGCEVPQWTPDSRAVVLKLKSVDTTSQKPSTHPVPGGSYPVVSVFSFDPTTDSAEEWSITSLDWLLGDLACFDVTSKEVQLLASNWGFSGCSVSPDGQAVAILKKTNLGADNGQLCIFHDLVVVPLDGSPSLTLATQIPQSAGISLSWSPDSQFLAYTTLGSAPGKTGQLFVVPANKSVEPMQLSGEGTPDLAHPYESPRWSLDGKHIYCLTSSGIWITTIDGSSKRSLPLNLNHQVRYWVQRPLKDSVLLPDNSVQFVVRDPGSKNEGLARLDMDTGQGTLLTEFAKTCAGGILGQEMAQDGSWYFVAEAADHPAEIWCIRGDDTVAQRLCSLNPNLGNVTLGTSRLVEWWAVDGKKLQGALMLPSQYVEGQPLPLIVHVYSGSLESNLLHHFGFKGTHIDNAQLLASHGYAVLYPDLPMEDHDPLHQFPGLVLPAINHLIDLGIADPNRVGVMGHSYGGYNVMSLITQTNRFRTAVSMAGLVNLTSFYGVLTDEGVSLWIDWAESGQGRMGGTLWEKRANYIENSPLFYLDRVNTPVLLVSGTADPGVAQSEAAFSALRRLGKRVELCLYHQEDHSPVYWSEASLRDLCERVLAWFNTYL